MAARVANGRGSPCKAPTGGACHHRPVPDHVVAGFPASLPLDGLDPLPPGADAVPVDPATVSDGQLARIEFLVPPGRASLGLLPRMPRLRVIQTLSAGVDWLAGHVPDGVRVHNAAGVYDTPLAEWTLAAILAVLRGFPGAEAAQGRGAWEEFEPEELLDRHVVILGYGSIGRAVEDRLAPFGARISRVGRTARPGVLGIDDLDGILPSTGVLVVLLPLARTTVRLLDRRRLGLLPPGALVVNAGRGRVIDTAALRDEVGAGRLRAALDVVDPEPLPPDDPLWRMPGALITPHVGGDTAAAEKRAIRLAADQLRRYVAGEAMRNEVASYLLEKLDPA